MRHCVPDIRVLSHRDHGRPALRLTRNQQSARTFVVVALVILILLPAGPLDYAFGIRPRASWVLVMLLVGLNFVSYLARKALGAERGYPITGALAGLISSTVLTLQFARLSRVEWNRARALATGTLAASAVLPLRLELISAVLNPAVARHLLAYALPAFVVAAAFVLVQSRHHAVAAVSPLEPENPLHLGFAIQMAVVVEVVLLGIDYARSHLGSAGIVGSSALFGLADLDALTVAMNRLPDGPGVAVIAARGVGIGMLANTIVKLGIAIVIGERTFSRWTCAGLGGSAVVLAIALLWR